MVIGFGAPLNDIVDFWFILLLLSGAGFYINWIGHSQTVTANIQKILGHEYFQELQLPTFFLTDQWLTLIRRVVVDAQCQSFNQLKTAVRRMSDGH